MIPVIIYPHYLQVDHIGLSTDPKPEKVNKGAIYFERDTELTYNWNGQEWIEQPKGIYTRNLLWNTESWEFELATMGGSPSAALVSVDNFPAIISGTSVPISDANADPTKPYKITDIATVGEAQYFGYVNHSGGWYIMKLTETGARYAKGSDNYLTSWGNKLILDYDYFYNIF